MTIEEELFYCDGQLCYVGEGVIQGDWTCVLLNGHKGPHKAFDTGYGSQTTHIDGMTSYTTMEWS